MEKVIFSELPPTLHQRKRRSYTINLRSCVSGRILWNLSFMGTLLFTTSDFSHPWEPLPTQDILFPWSRKGVDVALCKPTDVPRISLRQDKNSGFPPGLWQDQHEHTRQGTRCSLSRWVIPVKCSKRSWGHTHFRESWWGKAIACLVCTIPSQGEPRFADSAARLAFRHLGDGYDIPRLGYQLPRQRDTGSATVKDVVGLLWKDKFWLLLQKVF